MFVVVDLVLSFSVSSAGTTSQMLSVPAFKVVVGGVGPERVHGHRDVLLLFPLVFVPGGSVLALHQRSSGDRPWQPSRTNLAPPCFPCSRNPRCRSIIKIDRFLEARRLPVFHCSRKPRRRSIMKIDRDSLRLGRAMYLYERLKVYRSGLFT
jgi:hypothetical protein